MELKKYQKEDSAMICSWIKDEKSLYQWSADRIGKFPLSDNDLNENYAPDDRIVRFGFVIVDPVLRGQGNGKKMLQLAIDYAKNILRASRITLGVFTNNDRARYCYESVGFRPVGRTEIYKMPVGEWECTEMELVIT